jgi:hypothetical protein
MFRDVFAHPILMSNFKFTSGIELFFSDVGAVMSGDSGSACFKSYGSEERCVLRDFPSSTGSALLSVPATDR